MSFMPYSLPGGVYSPGELQMIRRVVDALDREGLLPPCREEREPFFRHLLLLYDRGHCSEPPLLDHARAAARLRFAPAAAAFFLPDLERNARACQRA